MELTMTPKQRALRDEAAGIYECTTQDLKREWNDNGYKYRDFQAGHDFAHDRAHRSIEALKGLIGLIENECPHWCFSELLEARDALAEYRGEG